MRDCRGFTLIEQLVVVLVIAVLLAIGIPSFLQYRERAQDRHIHTNLANGIKVEAAYGADAVGFTADPAELAAIEPALDFSGAQPESLHVQVQDVVNPGDAGDVLIYARSDSGEWFGVRHTQIGPAAGTFTCRGTAEADVDDFADCTGQDW